MPFLSVCLIVKNEEKVLPRCLESVRKVADEIVVVDTGSTDQTVEIAESFGAKMGYFEWCDDFAAARNASLDLASGEWILQLDADEELWREDLAPLRKLVRRKDIPQVDSVYVLLRNLQQLPAECAEGASLPDPQEWAQSVNHFQRLFRNRPHLRYSGIIHEAIPNVKHSILSEISIYHYGYDSSPEVKQRRFDRNRKLTRKHIKLEPENPAAYFYAGGTALQGNRKEEAEELFRKAVELSDPLDRARRHFLLNALVRLAQLTGQHGDFEKMKEYAEQALVLEPEYLDPWLRLGEALFHLGYYWPAERALRRYLEIREELRQEKKFTPYTLYLLDEEPHAHYLLGALAQQREDLSGAEANYQHSLELAPDGPNNPAEALEKLYREAEVN